MKSYTWMTITCVDNIDSACITRSSLRGDTEITKFIKSVHVGVILHWFTGVERLSSFNYTQWSLTIRQNQEIKIKSIINLQLFLAYILSRIVPYYNERTQLKMIYVIAMKTSNTMLIECKSHTDDIASMICTCKL